MTIFSVTDYLKFCKVFTYLKLFGKGLLKKCIYGKYMYVIWYEWNLCIIYYMSETYVLYTIWVKPMYEANSVIILVSSYAFVLIIS